MERASTTPMFEFRVHSRDAKDFQHGDTERASEIGEADRKVCSTVDGSLITLNGVLFNSRFTLLSASVVNHSSEFYSSPVNCSPSSFPGCPRCPVNEL